MFKKIIFLGLLILLVLQCRPVENKKLTNVNWDFSDIELQKLYTLQDRLETDSLISLLSHTDPTYRYGAAMAFASHHDEKAIPQLGELLYDEVSEVRIAAAYALGQIGDEAAEPLLIAAFQDSSITSDKIRSTILEAVGKTGNETSLKNIATVSTFLRADTALLEGQAWGIYRYALRDKVLPEGTSRMVDFIARKGYPKSVRLIAANYLARAKNIKLDSMAALSLSKAFSQSPDVDARMALALALGKTKSGVGLNALTNRYRIEKDYRVKCNVIRALGNFDYLAVEPLVMEALKDENLHVSRTAAQFFVNNGKPRSANVYWKTARDTSLHWQTQLSLYRAANKYLPVYFEVTKTQINRELKNRLTTARNNYEKAEVLKALSEYPWNYRFIKDQSFDMSNSIVRTASVEALASIVREPDFVKFFGSSGSKKVKRELKDYFVEAIEKSDVAMMAVAASVLGEPDLGFKELIDSLDFLEKAQEKLTLPKETETWQEIHNTLDYLNGKEESGPAKIKYNHPIDWEMVNGLGDNVSADLKTDKGTITIEFYPNLAPGSVVNFVKLAKNGYFDGKNFHRVVANFVVQGGCSRGDGYGGLDYSIRSELGQANFDRAGVIGMARTDPHTECTQFFITHSPAPHLDGKYTIFGQVLKGMDVVQEIEQGDKIIKVTVN